MAIINQNTLTVDQQKSQITASMNLGFNRLNQTFTKIFQQIWVNPNFTPQQIMDAFGSDAASLFQLSGQVQDLLNTIVPNVNQLTPPNAFTINQDGTVTIGAKI